MRREIVVNGRFLSRRITGVERHGREVLSYLGDNCRVIKTRFNGARGHIWEQFILPLKLNSGSILWSPANSGPMFIKKHAVTIHDITPIEHPEWYAKDFATWYRLFIPIILRYAQLVFTPSEYMEEKIRGRYGVKNITVTPNAIDIRHFNPQASQSAFYLPDRYILFLGSIQDGKNLATLLHAWKLINNDYKKIWLVIAGRHDRIFSKIDLGEPERTIFPGYINEEDLPGVYAQAELFILPSLDEGFGLPALEAMACRTPVIVSDGGALPEVVGDAALVFNRLDARHLAETIQRCLNDITTRESLMEKGMERIKNYSWAKTAGLIREKLNEI